MSDRSVFQLLGAWSATPAVGQPSSDPNIPARIDERLNLDKKHHDEIDLTVDTPIAVFFGGLAGTGAHVIIIKPVGATVTARLTSSKGATQSVPISDLLILLSQDFPFTAIDLIRTAGVQTRVKIFLGQRV